MKTCFECHQTKPLDDFYKHPRMVDGHLGKCKECAKTDTQLNYRKNFAYYKEYNYIRSQTPERRSRGIQYYKDHPGKVKERRQNYNEKYPERYAVRRIVRDAIQDKRLIKKPCKKCGVIEKVHGHHENYSKPLDVVWLCPAHHSALHRERRQATVN